MPKLGWPLEKKNTFNQPEGSGKKSSEIVDLDSLWWPMKQVHKLDLKLLKDFINIVQT